MSLSLPDLLVFHKTKYKIIGIIILLSLHGTQKLTLLVLTRVCQSSFSRLLLLPFKINKILMVVMIACMYDHSEWIYIHLHPC